jgi:hypothetical protein
VAILAIDGGPSRSLILSRIMRDIECQIQAGCGRD